MSDPSLLDYEEPPEELEAPPALQDKMETFWGDLGELLRSGAAASADDPLLEQLRGRALALGVASLFVSGVFEALGISVDDAERIAHASTGGDLPARASKPRRRPGSGGRRISASTVGK